MIIKLIGMIYGRHSTIYRRMVDAKESSVEIYKDSKIARQLRRISEGNSLKNPKNCKELYNAGKDVAVGFSLGIMGAMKESKNE